MIKINSYNIEEVDPVTGRILRFHKGNYHGDQRPIAHTDEMVKHKIWQHVIEEKDKQPHGTFYVTVSTTRGLFKFKA